jgi:hypothetical protein
VQFSGVRNFGAGSEVLGPGQGPSPPAFKQPKFDYIYNNVFISLSLVSIFWGTR